jgi:diacylglycerol kinase family enzyme
VAYVIVFNPEAGGPADGLVERAASRLADVDLLPLHPGTDLGPLIGEAAAEDRTVVAAGGDGTINTVVQHLAGRGTLGVLPGGTFNHFARDLGLRDEEAALAALEGGTAAEVDLGRADGRFFVNGLGMGLYPDSVREREESEGEERLGPWPAILAASYRALRGADPLVGRIEADGDARALAAWILFVGNNRYEAGPAGMRGRERLDEGVLDLSLVLAGPRSLSRIRVARKLLMHKEWRTGRVVHRVAERVAVRLEAGARLVARDGELEGPTEALEAEIVPKALRVLVPEAA